MNLVNDILISKNRKTIYNYILKYPGIHLSELVRQLDINEGAIRYHIKYLKNQGLIEKKYENGYTHFYITNKIGTNDKIILNILRKDTPRNIILYLLVITAASQTELSMELEKDPTTIAFHLKKLLDSDIIEPARVSNRVSYTNLKKSKFLECTPTGREIIYILKDPYLIYNLLTIYKDKLFDAGNTSNILNFFELLFLEKPSKKLKGHTSKIDRGIKTFFEIFPLPFCA